ncbi:MAG: hypothetical protein J7M05_13530, partial [Anaerolineae bacterium]|nr:hypothetical protein [Anaerolineae bacterium]
MRTIQLRVAFILLLGMILAVSIPAMAWSPEEEGSSQAGVADGGAQPQSVGAEPLWVPSGAHPGFYAARDNRNLDPATYNIVGGHQSFYWDQLEPTEGNYQWHYIDGFLA